MENNNNSYPIAAIATPSGVGAISIVRVSGYSLNKIFYSITKKNSLSKPRFASLCSIYSPINNKLIDKCIITYFKAPLSFTGEDVLEINCHGGNLIPQLIIESLIFLGVKNALPGEFSYRAFLNNKIDLIQAESISSLISSKNDLSHDIALKNLSGFFSKTINSLSKDVSNLLIILENELNFNENEISFTSKEEITKNLNKLYLGLKKLYNTSFFGKVINSGVRILLIGRPNVGKSSLFNHLLGLDRAIVSNISGTTRDSIEGNSEINGIPVCFVDTAGYWESSDFLESLGIKKTLNEINFADIVLFIDDKNPHKQFKQSKLKIDKNKLLFVLSKKDKPLQKNKKDNFFYTSSKTGNGIDVLIDHLSSLISSNKPTGPIITSLRQKDLIASSLKTTKICIDMIKNDLETDLLVSNIQDILYNIESLVGKVYSKDIINNIFIGFCIGK